MGNLKDVLEELEKRENQEHLKQFEEEYLKIRSDLYNYRKKLKFTIRKLDERVRNLSNRIQEIEDEKRNLEKC